MRIPLVTELSLAPLIVATLACFGASPSSEGSGGGTLPRDSFIGGSRVHTLLPPDAIPSIDHPRFVPASQAGFMRDDEPVIGVVVDGQARAYSAWHLDHHEIVNDHVGDSAIAVTW